MLNLPTFVYYLSRSYASTRWPGYNADMTLKVTKDANSETLALDAGMSRDKSKRLIIDQEGSLRLGAEKSAAFTGTLKVPFKVCYTINYQITEKQK